MDKGNIRFGLGSTPNRGYDNNCASWGCSFEMGWNYGFRHDRILERPYTESGALNLLIAGERMRVLLSLPSKRKAPASVSQ